LFERIKPYRLVLQFIVLPIAVCLVFYFKPKIDFSQIPPTFHFYFWIGISLMPMHWLLEFFKWKIILRNLKLPEKQDKTSFASGIISEFLIPGIPSNFIGRVFFFEKKNRFELSAWIQLANLTQFCVTLIFGLVSLFYLNLTPSRGSIYVGIGLASLVLILFIIRKLKIIDMPKAIQGLSLRKNNVKPIGLLSILSLIRFLIFSLQFGLILHSFSIAIEFQLFTYIWLSYLLVSFSPSLFLGNLVIRESVTVSVFQMANYPVLPVLYSAFFIWFVNNFLPVCIAWCYLTFFKKTE